MLDNLGKLVLRVGVSAMMLPYGYKKVLTLFSDDPIKFVDPIGIGEVPSMLLAVFAEFVCAILVIIGFKSRLSSIPLIITMVVAVFIVHADKEWVDKQYAALFCIGFIAIALLGSGKYSIDGLLGKKK